ncbi:hypothetical protein [Spiroplasma clarkii]|nr:hypothetical protein [Spiroplasma clarkii]
MEKTIFNFYYLDKPVTFFSPANLMTQIPFEALEDGKESVFDLVFAKSKYTPFALLSHVCPNQVLIISSLEIYEIYHSTISQMLSGKGERPKTVFNYFGYDQGVGFEQPKVLAENKQPIKTSALTDKFNYKTKVFSPKNSAAYIGALIAAVGNATCIFTNKSEMKQFLQGLISDYELIENWIIECEKTGKIFNDEIIRNNLLSEYAIWKTTQITTIKELTKFKMDLK